MQAGHNVILHALQQNPSTLCCLLFPSISRLWDISLYELLQAVDHQIYYLESVYILFLQAESVIGPGSL